MQIEGVSAVVTGGASGLGEATVRRLHAAGASVVIADRDEAKGNALASELGAKVRFSKADVSVEADVQAAVSAAAALAPLRIAVSCAGIAWAQRTVNKEGIAHDLGFFTTVVTVNLIGTFNLLRLAAAEMTKNPPLEDGARGVVINTASVAAFDGQVGQLAYAASKAGVVGMTLPAARDLSKSGIRVMTIAPGTFDTPMMALLPEDQRAVLAAGIPFPSRLGTPDDFAKLAQHIAENDYLNGEVIRLDGALRMPPKRERPSTSMNQRLYAYVLSAVALTATLAPAFRSARDDDFPLSTYPMFARERSRSEAVTSAVLVRKDGSELPVPTGYIANSEPMLAIATLQKTVAQGPKAARKLCRTLARRILNSSDAELRATEQLSIVTRSVDAIEYLNGRAKHEGGVVQARCPVNPGAAR